MQHKIFRHAIFRMKRVKIIGLLSLFLLAILLPVLVTTVQKQQQVQQKAAAPATCPAVTDTKTNVDPITQLCYSNSDPLFSPGFNTTGGQRSCGPINCSSGNQCVVKVGTQCFAGKGPSGFNTPGCTASSSTPLPACPAPMKLTMQVLDPQGKGVSNISLKVTYADAPPSTQPGQTTVVSTGSNGTAVVANLLYSGDHFIISPNDPAYSFVPTVRGSTTNIGDQEMNIISSCGTQLENGTSNAPCKFTATLIPGKLTPTPTIPPLTVPPFPSTSSQPISVSDNPNYYAPSTRGFMIAFAILGIGAIVASVL